MLGFLRSYDAAVMGRAQVRFACGGDAAASTPPPARELDALWSRRVSIHQTLTLADLGRCCALPCRMHVTLLPPRRAGGEGKVKLLDVTAY